MNLPATRLDPLALRVRDFSLWYGNFQALHGVTADIPKHRITAMIGPSGCGKSTLLRSLNRMNERYGNVRTQGSITIHGKDILDADVSVASLRKEVGMVFQRPNPLPISIFENVVFGLRSHLPKRELSRERLAEAVETSLKRVALWDTVKDRLHEPAVKLSLEQQQKLCIARLLPLKPTVILMDEPCSALDAEGIAAIEGLMAELKDTYTLVIVTHSMAQARRVSDECIYMLLGQIIEHRPTADLFTSPQDARTASYVEGRYG
jgi:phosphate transport system ATP-binding protein